MGILYLYHKDIKVAQIETDDQSLVRIVSIYEPKHMPIGTNQTITSVADWLKRRNLSPERKGLKGLLSHCEINSVAAFPLLSPNVALTDYYWFATEQELENNVTWEDIDPLVYGEWNDSGRNYFLGNLDDIRELDSPDFALNGPRRKFWLKEQNGTFLAKEEQNNGMDTYAEVAAYIVAASIGIPNAETFWGVSDHDELFTLSRCITEDGDVEMVPFWQLEKEGFTSELFEGFAQENGFWNKLQDLYLFDYLIGNTGRTDEDIAILRNPQTLELIGLCPTYGHANAFRLSNFKNRDVISAFTGNMLEEDWRRAGAPKKTISSIENMISRLELLREEMGMSKETIDPILAAFRTRAEELLV
ncbi:MAG: hypothetical protein Q4B26_02230 [Eubacteriales bacterium]|nr:hypothetical protein [Eubacteriales bacterium]